MIPVGCRLHTPRERDRFGQLAIGPPPMTDFRGLTNEKTCLRGSPGSRPEALQNIGVIRRSDPRRHRALGPRAVRIAPFALERQPPGMRRHELMH